MKKSPGLIIIGIVFTLIGSGLLALLLFNWGKGEVPWFGIVGSLVFVVVGVVSLFFGIYSNKKVDNFEKAKKAGGKDEELFRLEDDVKNIRDLEVKVFTIPIPFAFLVVFGYVLYMCICKGLLWAIVLTSVIEAFMLFVCVGIIVSFFKKRRIDKSQGIAIKGSLKKLILSRKVIAQGSTVETKFYRLLITYDYNNQTCEYLTEETYSADQVKLIKKMFYIPLLIKDDVVEIDKENFLHAPKNYVNQAEVEVQKGFVGYGNSRVGQLNVDSSIHKIEESMDKVERKYKISNMAGLSNFIITTIFCALFCGGAIYAVLQDLSAGTVVFLILAILMCGYFMFRVVSMMLVRGRRKKILQHGYSAFATNFKLTLSNRGGNTSSSPIYGVAFEFLDEFGMHRRGIESFLKVSNFFFEAYGVDKLPIKVLGKRAEIDYEELLKYQNN